MNVRHGLVALLGLAVVSSGAIAKEMAKAEVVPGELIVKIKAGKMHSFLSKKDHGSDMMVNRTIPVSFGNYVVVKVGEAKSLDSAINELKADPDVIYSEPNFIYRIVDGKKDYIETISTLARSSSEAIMTPDNAPVNDPMLNQLWGLQNTGKNEPSGSGNGVVGADVNAYEAWAKFQKGNKNVKIAVIDTGIDYNHPDLKNNVWVNEKELNGKPGVDDDGNGFIDDIHGYNFAKNTGDPLDGHGHGSHCSGTIAAEHDNGVGVAGVMSEATLVAVKFLGDDGSGSTENAIKSIDYATKLNVDIMSNSWGGGGFSQALMDSIKAASEKGILFVAAAGNSSANNDQTANYPSNYDVPNVIAIAAHTAQDTMASFSCYGKRTVDVAAPGKNILSTVKGNTYAVYSGTSMATPHTSGVLGLLLANEGRLPLDDVRERLIATSVPVKAYRGKMVAEGRINAYNLLADVRPERNTPNPDAWTRMSLNEVLESAHPYAASMNVTKEISIPGAKYIRLVASKIDLESGYDMLKLKDKNGEEAGTLSGKGENIVSDYVEGEKMIVNFVSDSSVQNWGYLIDTVEYQ